MTSEYERKIMRVPFTEITKDDLRILIELMDADDPRIIRTSSDAAFGFRLEGHDTPSGTGNDFYNIIYEARIMKFDVVEFYGDPTAIDEARIMTAAINEARMKHNLAAFNGDQEKKKNDSEPKSFESWYRENKDDQEFRDMFEAHRIECRDNEVKAGTFKGFMREYFAEKMAMEDEW
jgi:hypothetical protein